MRFKYFFLLMLMPFTAGAQIRYSVLFNIGQLPYQCYELDALISVPDRTLQLLAGINYTQAHINSNKQRFKNGLDERYQKTGDELLQGPGFAIQARLRLSPVETARTINSYVGLGINHYSYSGQYYENEYVYKAPFYHYELVKYKYSFNRSTLGPQLLLVFNKRHITAEFGAGFHYAIARLPEEVDSKRNLKLSRLDYGFTGYAPALNFKLGYNFN